MDRGYPMYRVCKLLHLLGLALFLGSVLGHIVTAVTGGTIGSADFLAAREQIDAATRTLTLPGLGLMILSGLGLAWSSPRRPAWMGLHAGLSVVVIALTALVVVPAGREILAGAQAIARGDGGSTAIAAALATEHRGGSANLVLTLLVVTLGVYKPALRVFGRLAARCPPKVVEG
jgi:hypothetical protein